MSELPVETMPTTPNKLKELRALFTDGPAVVMMAKADALAVLDIIDAAQYSARFLLDTLRDRSDENIRPHMLLVPTSMAMGNHTHCFISSIVRVANTLKAAGFGIEHASVGCMQAISPADFTPDDESEAEKAVAELARAVIQGTG